MDDESYPHSLTCLINVSPAGHNCSPDIREIVFTRYQPHTGLLTLLVYRDWHYYRLSPFLLLFMGAIQTITTYYRCVTY